MLVAETHGTAARAARPHPESAQTPSVRSISVASASQTESVSVWLGASTITRTSGSVPDGRTSTRPRPERSAFAAVDGRPDAAIVDRGTQRLTALGANVDETLRQLAHPAPRRQVAVTERLERQQRAGDPVARRERSPGR